ncbi:DoxX family protein [Salimicrobium halophilum]|uniref:Uncharacterized membrane protein YphA, DoxX/SURF4 family n=1 Tax=Salimicrobium halophilum TaxID=86666 RepID=A0A1G8UVL2_9BACI|nr:DoxX family protein [Salimicrobium halophilum]SDJ57828.1 Uncharacterized membrane protein YphA, DoxX/SURF4 family [Salimicrobium halophilum]
MNKEETGSLIVRVILGIIFFMHGLDKFQGGLGNTAGFFDSVGVPGFLAYVVAFIELIGGIVLILGIGTKVIGTLFAIIMVGAILTAKRSAGFLGGYELDLALLGMSIYTALAGNKGFALGETLFTSDRDKTLEKAS